VDQFKSVAKSALLESDIGFAVLVVLSLDTSVDYKVIYLHQMRDDL
jgi:hypothetical protein